MIQLLPQFNGYIVNNIKCVNDGDICQLYVCKDLLENKTEDSIVYIDIGAYVGGWTSMISVFTQGRAEIHAYEPSLNNFKQLQNNCEKLQNVNLHNYGIGEDESEVGLVLTGGGGHIHSFNDTLQGIEPTEIIKIKKMKIDKPVHIMKIDVDGYEGKLLPTLYESFPLIHTIICEFNVFDFSSNKEECSAITENIFNNVFNSYPYIYACSRNLAPFCVELKRADIKDWFEEHYDTHLSTDLVFTKQSMRSIICVPFGKKLWYA